MTSNNVRSSLAVAVAAIALLGALLAAPASAAVRHLDGTVISKSAKSHSFRISTQGGTMRIRVNGATVFERISGFRALHRGLRIEVDAKRTSRGLVARRVEPRAAAAGGGDDHGGHGADDGPNHI